MNDHIVKPVSSRQVLSSQAYILFYSRGVESDPAPTATRSVPTTPVFAKTGSKLVPPGSVGSKLNVTPQPSLKVVIKLPQNGQSSSAATSNGAPKITSYSSQPLVQKRTTPSIIPSDNTPVKVTATATSVITAKRPLVDPDFDSSNSSDEDNSKLVIDEVDAQQPNTVSSAPAAKRPTTPPTKIKFLEVVPNINGLKEESSKKKEKKRQKNDDSDEDKHHHKKDKKNRKRKNGGEMNGEKRKKKAASNSSSNSSDESEEEWVEKKVITFQQEKPSPETTPKQPERQNSFSLPSNGQETKTPKSVFALGSHVSSWDGGQNSIDAQLEQANTQNRQRLSENERWKRDFDNEIDAGRQKKVRSVGQKNDNYQPNSHQDLPPAFQPSNYSSGNAFQAVQNSRNNSEVFVVFIFTFFLNFIRHKFHFAFFLFCLKNCSENFLHQTNPSVSILIMTVTKFLLFKTNILLPFRHLLNSSSSSKISTATMTSSLVIPSIISKTSFHPLSHHLHSNFKKAAIL